MQTQHKSWIKRAAIPVALTIAAATLAGCATGAPATNEPTQDPNAEIVVWGDATRQPAFEAYQAANPDVKLKFEAIDPSTYLSKIQLANRVGSGWPDVLFDPQPNDVASLQSPLFNFTQNLDDLVPADVQKDFATENSLCKIDGHLYCLQNDLAQDVLWYNKPLLEEFGYSVPTTWDEYQELGEKVAADHPGYLVGAAGSTMFYEYLWSSGCPLQTVKSSTEVVINTEDEKCTRVTSMLDPMLENGSVSRLGPFDPGFAKEAQAGKLLMLPAASWFGEYMFKPETGFHYPEGALAAAPMPLWDGEDTNWSGAQGGGIYVVSQHSANLKRAVEVAQFAATDSGYQTSSPAFPAYKPAAKAWLEKISSDPFYAEDPSAVLVDQASKINPGTAVTRYDANAAFTNTVSAAVSAGNSMSSAMPALQSQLASLAATAGYEVSSK